MHLDTTCRIARRRARSALAGQAGLGRERQRNQRTDARGKQPPALAGCCGSAGQHLDTHFNAKLCVLRDLGG